MARVEIDLGTDDCLAHIEDNVAVITLNRPEARNAMSGGMTQGLAKALEQAETDPEVRAVVVTGAGGAFCAGGDVKGMASGGEGGGRAATLDERIHAQRLNQRATAGRMHLMPKPVLASLPGAAAGAGLALALAADMRIMSENAFITSAFAKVAFSGDYGGSYFLSQLVGQGKAREIYFLSDRVTSDECLRIGIANQVVPADELEAATIALARRLAEGPPVAYRYMKENFNRIAQGAGALDCLDLEATHHVHAGLTDDHKNAARAFVEKTQPVFEGK
ncbi:MAG: enoyl-CoA hydratase [Pseudomonadales bacterium]|nr:enoyl-CoA hydratase [Pseudomonadales bacterium]